MNPNPVIFLIGKIREKANKLLIDELGKCGMRGIVPSHGAILRLLHKKGELTMKEAANLIGKDKSTATALVSKLEKNGYVKREKSLSDGRSTVISLTPKGENSKDDFLNISNALFNKIDNALNEDEKQELIRLLEKLNSNW